VIAAGVALRAAAPGAPRQTLDRAAIAVAAAWTLSWALSPVGGSPLPMLALVLLVCGVARLDRSLARGLLAAMLLVGVTALALVAAVEASKTVAARAPFYPGLDGWGGYPELGFLGMLVVPLLASLVVHAPSRSALVAGTVAGAAAGAGLILSLARASLLAALAGIGVVLVSSTRRRRLMAVAGGILLLAVVAIQAPRLAGYGSEVLSMAPQGPTGARLEAWREAATMVPSRPVVGWGPGGYALAFRQRHRESRSDARFHAHNQYLHTIIETGVLGAAALGWFAAVVAAAALRGPRTTATAGALRVGLAGALAATAFRFLLDYFDPAGAGERVLVFAAVWAGLAVALSPAPPEQPPLTYSTRS
jgi:O-antigen ligase